ncbi:MAG TPA: protein disulfide isomerase family protein [Candidatus Paceibacterota bacterium]|nr:protein disulfide isomerase family protein [Candidatus Paceibacterota bacterium]
MKKGMLVFWLAVIALIAAGIGSSIFIKSGPGQLDSFAQCLKDSGTVYYGAFWCPHCQATNRLFGKSKALLPYVECSTPDGRSQQQICKDKGINGYPTWVFPDGNILTGERTLEELSEASGCELPST